MSIRTLALAASAVLLGACATAPQPLYQWGGFPSHAYDALRGEGKTPVEQVDLMVAHAQKVSAAGQKLPPGYHAHLGLLLLKLGRNDAAQAAFEAERAAFPESSQYIDAMAKAAAKIKS